jgi:hypothetical protein
MRLFHRLREAWRTPWRTRRAMFAYWLSGQLRWFKWPQRSYMFSVAGRDENGFPEFSEPQRGPLRWMPHPWATDLMVWAMAHDPEHSDHWALDHRRCMEAYECPVCKGLVHPIFIGPGGPDEDDMFRPLAS